MCTKMVTPVKEEEIRAPSVVQGVVPISKKVKKAKKVCAVPVRERVDAEASQGSSTSSNKSDS